MKHGHHEDPAADEAQATATLLATQAGKWSPSQNQHAMLALAAALTNVAAAGHRIAAALEKLSSVDGA